MFTFNVASLDTNSLSYRCSNTFTPFQKSDIFSPSKYASTEAISSSFGRDLMQLYNTMKIAERVILVNIIDYTVLKFNTYLDLSISNPSTIVKQFKALV